MADTPPTPEPAEPEIPTITVDIRGHPFRFRADLNIMALTDFAGASLPGASSEDQINALRTFERYMAHPGDKDALHHHLRSQNPPVTIQEITDVVGKLMERIVASEGVDIPTQAPSPSSNGGSATPSTSPVSSPATAVVD